MTTAASAPLIEVDDLKVHFPVYGGVFRHQIAAIKAVDGVALTAAPPWTATPQAGRRQGASAQHAVRAHRLHRVF